MYPIELLRQHLEGLGVPILGRLPIGHDAEARCIALERIRQLMRMSGPWCKGVNNYSTGRLNFSKPSRPKGSCATTPPIGWRDPLGLFFPRCALNERQVSGGDESAANGELGVASGRALRNGNASSDPGVATLILGKLTILKRAS